MKKINNKFIEKVLIFSVYLYMGIIGAIMLIATICGDGGCGLIDLLR